MGKRTTKKAPTKPMRLVGFRFPDELVLALEERAVREGRTMSNMARRLIELGLAAKASA